MSYYVVFGDIHPSMMVRINDEEIKAISVKLSIGIKPEDIRLQHNVRDGSRNLGVLPYLNIRGTDYCAVSKGQYLCLEKIDNDPF